MENSDKIQFTSIEDFTNYLIENYGKANAKLIRNYVEYTGEPNKPVAYHYWEHDGTPNNITFYKKMADKDFSSPKS